MQTIESHEPQQLSARDTMRVFSTVFVPTVAKGAIIRRPTANTVVDGLHADAVAVAALRHFRATYGSGPLQTRFFGRDAAILLSPEDVRRVLAATPEPFSPATMEKVAALGHFQPNGVLISNGESRAARRAYNEAVLHTDQPQHPLSGAMVDAVIEETRSLLRNAGTSLRWKDFTEAWWRIVRRVVLGSDAAGDTDLTDQLARLRSNANWAYLHPGRAALREQFTNRLRRYVDRAQSGSLAAQIADTAAAPEIDVAGQIPHWLFAFDAGGIATFRTLALLAGHPTEEALAVQEMSTGRQGHLRDCVLESLRLWPTTPLVLRESTTETQWGSRTLPARTSFIIFAPFFHRDSETLDYADSFEPAIWRDGRAAANPGLVPFSAGPAQCPGRNIVLLITSAMIAVLYERHRFQLIAPALQPMAPLPASLNHFRIRLAIGST